MTSSPEDFDNILHDESLAPLKRNHACLNCKRRKTRCCGTRPVCSPCMRSHAHSLRSANKNNTAPPVLCCEWADEGDEDSDRPAPQPSTDAKKRVDVKKVKGSLGGKALEREKEKRRDEEKETLLARIAELESRLANLSPSGQHDQSRSASASFSNHATPESMKSRSLQPSVQDYLPSQSSQPSLHGAHWVNEPARISPGTTPPDFTTQPDFSHNGIDLSGLFMVPLHWPAGLPSPFLLDHLVETFYAHAPQITRILHKPTLLTRLKLPPTHENFPHSSLLHAICAHAAPYTAWVNNFSPHTLEDDVERHKKLFGGMENVEDFGLAQAEMSQKSIRLASQFCMKEGATIFEMCQATVLLTDFYFQKGMPLQGWIMGGTGTHLLKALEFMNKNPREGFKEPIADQPKDWIQREERLATVWMAFILDSSCTLNSYWNGGVDFDDVGCHFPISAEQFKSKEIALPPNPQSARSPDVLVNHPVADSFVLTAKASTLVTRSAKWVRKWLQRDIVPGDELSGMRSPSFVAIVNDIYAFQASVTSPLKTLFKQADANQTNAVDAGIILVHVLPNVALCMLHEQFADWRSVQDDYAIGQVQRAFEGVLGILHLIPSNLDISLVMNTPLMLSLFTCGRLIANFIQRSVVNQQYGLVLRYRADLQTVQSTMLRYGQKHAVGVMMSGVLSDYIHAIEKGKGDNLTLCLTTKAEDEKEDKHQCAILENVNQYFIAPNPISRDDNLPPKRLHRRSEGAQWGGSNYTPPGGSSGASASLSGSSGAPTPNDMLDFTNHAEYGDSSGPISFLPENNGLTMALDADMYAAGAYNSQGQFVVEQHKVAGSSAPELSSFAVNVDGQSIVWATM